MMTTEESITDEDTGVSAQREYWSQVEKSDGFDLEGVRCSRMIPIDCERHKLYPFPILVNLYAKLGLHRYNMIEGTNFELGTLVKFNMLANCVSSFYMTLLAHVPASSIDLQQKTFQIRVDEKRCRRLDLTVSIARTKDEVTTKEPFIPHFYGDAAADDFFKGELPDWPSDDALNDGNRFYLVKESEWQATSWISLYLELVICVGDRSNSNRDLLSHLEILKVAIETPGIEDVNERLKAKSAHIYIMFKGFAEPRVPQEVFEIGEHVERKAVVRRVIDEHTGCLTLLGKLFGGELLSSRARGDEDKAQTSEKRPRLG